VPFLAAAATLLCSNTCTIKFKVSAVLKCSFPEGNVPDSSGDSPFLNSSDDRFRPELACVFIYSAVVCNISCLFSSQFAPANWELNAGADTTVLPILQRHDVINFCKLMSKQSQSCPSPSKIPPKSSPPGAECSPSKGNLTLASYIPPSYPLHHTQNPLPPNNPQGHRRYISSGQIATCQNPP